MKHIDLSQLPRLVNVHYHQNCIILLLKPSPVTLFSYFTDTPTTHLICEGVQ